MASYSKDNVENNLFIIKTETVDNYTDYVIEVRIDSSHWTVNHRYSEFYELNEKLVGEHGVDKKLLPPKKAFGNTSESFIQKRRTGLERYLQILIKQFDRIPFELALFLDFPKYEINGVTQILAETLFNKGDALLQKDSTCSMDPLQLHAITERHTRPESVVSSHTRDIGHILDFVTRLSKLRVIGTDKFVGTSNINMNNLEYNLAMFKNIKYLELVKCNVKRINGLDHIRKSVEKLKVRKTLTSIQEFLTHNVIYWEDEDVEEGEESRPNIAWPLLTWVDMSENSITELPEAMRCLERMEYLDLHDNYLESIENLESVSYLTHLDVSINRIERLSDLHLKLGNVKSINLSSNKLETLESFSKLYSLEYLDVSNNQISQVIELGCLGSLPLLETLIITGNPVTVIPDYRIQVLKIFGSRAKEVTLDNKKGTEKELDTVAVLLALDSAKQPVNSRNERSSSSDSTSAAKSRSSTRDKDEGARNTELDTPVLQEKLQVLKLKSDRPNQLGEGTVQAESSVPRFDSPFNSPTRSSAESEQQYHSLCSTPEQSAGDADSAVGADVGPPADQTTVPVTDQAVDPVAETAVDPVTDQAVDPVAETAVDPVAETAGDSVTETADPVAETAGDPVTETAVDPVTETAGDPVTETADPVRNVSTSDIPLRGDTTTSTTTAAAATAEKCRTPPDGASNTTEADSPMTESHKLDVNQSESNTGDDIIYSKENEDNDAASEVSSPSVSFSVNSDDDDDDDDELPNSQSHDTLDASSSDKTLPNTNLFSSITIDTSQGTEPSAGVMPPVTPVKISIDVVDHIEQCLANVPNTLRLGNPLDKLTSMDGEELLNLFYHDSVIRRIGDSKEELCHVMWTSFVTYDNPDFEQPCLVLLSNQATYFIRAGKDHGKYSTRCISHEDLKEVCVGPQQQSLRLGGVTDSDYYCCVTRDPQLVQIFVARITFIVDTDFAKPESECEDLDSDEESIYDKKGGEPDHPSGVKYVYREDNSLDEIKFFLINECSADASRLEFVEKYFVHQSLSGDLHPCTAALTHDTVYIIQEAYANIPLPSSALQPPQCQDYTLERSVKLSDITDLAFHEPRLQVEVRIGSENIILNFCSLTLAESFHSKLISLSP